MLQARLLAEPASINYRGSRMLSRLVSYKASDGEIDILLLDLIEKNSLTLLCCWHFGPQAPRQNAISSQATGDYRCS